MGLSSRRVAAALVVAAHVAVAVAVWRELGHGGLSPELGSDAAGYRSLVVGPGRPYRDFDTVYPPLALGVFKAIGPGVFDVFVRRLLVVNLAAQALVTWMCFRGWGRRAGWSYLALSLPLTPMLYFRYDLLGVVCALGGLVLAARSRPVGAALAWVAGAFLRVWPGVLVPGLLARRERRAFWTATATAAGAMVAWVAWGGLSAPGQVLTNGGVRGWQFESVPATFLRLLTRDPLRNEEGAIRVGAPPRVVAVLLLFALAAVIVATWVEVARRGARAGVAEVVVVGSSLVFGTLLSPQFVIWVVPFAAVAAANGERAVERWVAVATLLTFVDWWMFDPHDTEALSLELVVAARNLALVATVITAWIGLHPRSAPVAGHARTEPVPVPGYDA